MNIIADTCFWISLCDPQQKDHEDAVRMMDKIRRDNRLRILVPHPVLYESLCSKMVRKPEQVKVLTGFWGEVDKVSDTKYINNAFEMIINQANQRNSAASMVDIVIMLMTEDAELQVKGILTKNGRDFSGFCLRHRIPMLDSMETLCSV